MKLPAFLTMGMVALLGALAWAAESTTRPADDYRQGRHHRDPSTEVEAGPVDSTHIPTPPPFSSAFSILLQRSLFYHGHFTPSDPNHPSGGQTQTQVTLPSYYRPENNIVFCGVTTEGRVTQVLLEDATTYRTEMLTVGDAVAPGLGKITRVSFDDLDYTLNGRTTRVQLGDNLLGVPVTDLTTQPSVATASSAEAAFSSGTAPGAAPAPAETGSMAAIIAELKAKRAAELGH